MCNLQHNTGSRKGSVICTPFYKLLQNEVNHNFSKIKMSLEELRVSNAEALSEYKSSLTNLIFLVEIS